MYKYSLIKLFNSGFVKVKNWMVGNLRKEESWNMDKEWKKIEDLREVRNLEDP